MFITIEGLGGVGKTTQSHLIADHINSNTRSRCFVTREPGGTTIGEAIREIFLSADHQSAKIKTQLLMIIAARYENFIVNIEPQLQQNKIVLCDRFIDSTVAYQHYGYGVDLEWISDIHEIAFRGIQWLPHKTFVLDTRNVESNISKSSSAHKYIQCDQGFHRRVRDGFRAISLNNPQRCNLINGEQSQHNITQEILHQLKL